MPEFDLSTAAAELAELINEDYDLDEPLGRLDILDYLGMLGLTLTPSDAATEVYQDRMVTYGMEEHGTDDVS